MRHVDYQKMTHEECARHMAISRTTATELYESARAKIADSLINGKVLCIEGGNYKVCEGAAGCKALRGDAQCGEKCDGGGYSPDFPQKSTKSSSFAVI